MKKKMSKSSVTIIIILWCMACVVGVRWILRYFKRSAVTATIPARVKGNPEAPLKITEYIDFQCSACARGSVMLKDYMEKYPSQIYLEVKYFPISRIHWHAFKSAIYAECAAQQNKFWPFHDSLFLKQRQWEKLIKVEKMFIEMAREANLDIDQLESCVQKEEIRRMVIDEKTQGQNQGVKSTPTYFINGKMVVGTKSLDEELKTFLGGS